MESHSLERVSFVLLFLLVQLSPLSLGKKRYNGDKRDFLVFSFSPHEPKETKETDNPKIMRGEKRFEDWCGLGPSGEMRRTQEKMRNAYAEEKLSVVA